MIQYLLSNMSKRSLLIFILISTFYSHTQAVVTIIPESANSTYGSLGELKRRQQTTTFVSTCGFNDGDANQPRTANSGFDCRVDTQHALWGFCPTTVISATDCGLAGNCVDSHSCSNGCGITGTPGITTFTWYVHLELMNIKLHSGADLAGCIAQHLEPTSVQPPF